MVQQLLRMLSLDGARLYLLLDEQATLAHAGAVAFSTFTTGESSAEDMSDAVERCEREGERIALAIEERLTRALVSPIDREDLHALSSQLDTLIDRMAHAARACVMLHVENPTGGVRRLTESLVACTEKIGAALSQLHGGRYTETVQLARELRITRRHAGVEYDDAVRMLTADEATDTPDALATLREKTILEELDHALEQCGTFADLLVHLAVKHG